MKQNHEQNPNSFKNVTEENLETTQVIEALTPEAIIKLKFFDDVINSAVKSGQITENAAKLARFLATATGRTVTDHSTVH